MKTFTDNAGRTWTIAVNTATIKRCRDLLDIDLLSILDDKADLLGRLVTDPVLLCDVIYCLCESEVEAKGIGDEDFGSAMAGDAIEHATNAFLEALSDFFPGRKRRVIQKALQKLKELETAGIEMAETRLESPELDRQLKALLSEPGDSSGNSPASSASTPGR